MKTLVSSHQITVRFNEVDSLGIVWHGHYIAYFEEGREAFGKTHGISYLDAKKEGFATPIVKTVTEHLLPVRYGEVITVKTTFQNTRSAKLIFKYIIKNAENKVVCTGETTQVFISIAKQEMSLYNPEFFKSWKLKHNLLDV